MKQIWNMIKYAMVFICNLLMLLFVHSYFNFLLMILMIVFPVVSIACAFLLEKQLSVSFGGAAERLTVDEPYLMAVILENKSIFPNMNVTLNMRLSNELFGITGEHQLCIPAYAKHSNVIDYQITNQYVGIWNASVTEIKITDWLGFIRLKQSCKMSREYVVYPAGHAGMEPDTAALSLGMSEMEETGRKGYDFSEVSDVREYIPGDKLQSVHWKLTAKQDALMVKERVSMSSSQLIILVELVNDETHVLNDILCAAYGIAEYLLSAQVPFTLYGWSVLKEDMDVVAVGMHEDIDIWMEQIFYEHAYEDGTLGTNRMNKILDADRKMLVIGRNGDHVGTIAFTYGSQVEGTICE